MTVSPGIYKRGQRYRVKLSREDAAAINNGIRYYGTYDAQEEAEIAREAAHLRAQDVVEIEGLTNEDEVYSESELWDAVLKVQGRTERREIKRAQQRITIPAPELPFALGYLGDWHLGNTGTDYRQLRADCETVRDTPRMFAGFLGDGWDNWIIAKLAHLERGQAIPFDAEVQLFCSVVAMLKGKLLWAIPGNHANWTRITSGIDQVREALRGTRVLYDPDEVVFTLAWGPHGVVYKARHKWKYSSVYNTTHGIETGWERGGVDFDVALGGHTHVGTFCRPFVRHGKKRDAVLIGTYELAGTYGREMGYADPHGRGCGAHVFYPDGRRLFIDDLQTAADFLTFLTKGQA